MKKAFIEPTIAKKSIKKENECGWCESAKLIYCPQCRNPIGAYDIVTRDVFYDGYYCNMCGAKILHIAPDIYEQQREAMNSNATHECGINKTISIEDKEKKISHNNNDNKIIKMFKKTDKSNK